MDNWLVFSPKIFEMIFSFVQISKKKNFDFFWNFKTVFFFSLENGNSRRSNISVEFSDLGFRVLAPGDLNASELDATLDMLYSRVKEQETNQISQVS